MTLAGHLRELRRRLIIAALALLAGMIASAFLTDWIITWLTFPIQKVAENIGDSDFTRLTFTTVTGPFDMRFRIALIAGIVISSPVWLWQIWRFITPGLTRREPGMRSGSSARRSLCSSAASCWRCSCCRTSSR